MVPLALEQALVPLAMRHEEAAAPETMLVCLNRTKQDEAYVSAFGKDCHWYRQMRLQVWRGGTGRWCCGAPHLPEICAVCLVGKGADACHWHVKRLNRGTRSYTTTRGDVRCDQSPWRRPQPPSVTCVVFMNEKEFCSTPRIPEKTLRRQVPWGGGVDQGSGTWLMSVGLLITCTSRELVPMTVDRALWLHKTRADECC